MPDCFEPMSILVAVVEAGSFSAAARQLRMPLATVSREVGEHYPVRCGYTKCILHA
ncbi:MAG: helix-turn-helix domain-containing protein [bacterium]|jgi:hypothetical protein